MSCESNEDAPICVAVDDMIAGEGCRNSKGSGEQRTKKLDGVQADAVCPMTGTGKDGGKSRDRDARAIVNRRQRQRKRSEESHRVNSDSKNQPAEQADAKHIE